MDGRGGLGLTATRSAAEPQRRGRLGGAAGASLALHVVFTALVVLMLSVPSRVTPYEPPPFEAQLVYLSDPGPGGGGGGSPDPAPAPIEIPEPSPAEPVPVEPDVVPAPERPPPPAWVAPVRTDATVVLRGAGIDRLAGPVPGGGGRGAGVGSGDGPGVGPGTGGGEGGGPWRPGAGIVNPEPILRVPPEYTAQAMQAKIEGTVVLECVVLADGHVGQVRIVKPLDGRFGLDQKAIDAARQWRFRPAMKDGEPVDIYVTLELIFRLH